MTITRLIIRCVSQFGHYIVGGVVVIVATRAVYRRYRRQTRLHITDYQPDMVYLFEFPASLNTASISPFSLKVATWLRMHRITYESIRGADKWSAKGQIPFIELNGEQVADSEVIVEHLEGHFQIPDEEALLTPEQRATGHMLQRMLDNHTFVSYGYYRYVEAIWAFLETWSFMGPFARRIVYRLMPGGFRTKAYHNGIGRHAPARIYELGIRDFRAASRLLADRTWVLGGAEASHADAVLFAHTCQVLDIPIDYPHRGPMVRECANLVAHCERMKREFWPDWTNLVRKARV